VQQAVGPDALEEERASIERWLRSPAALGYAWPGNVRELQNVLRSLLLGLSPQLDGAAPRVVGGGGLPPFIADCTADLDEMRAWYTDRVLAHTDHNLAQTARILGIDRSTLRRRRKRRSGSTKSKAKK
jgi:DNA-binding NtrC family response regulator